MSFKGHNRKCNIDVDLCLGKRSISSLNRLVRKSKIKSRYCWSSRRS